MPKTPLSIPTICAFLVHCFESRKLQPSTVKTIAVGIQFHFMCLDPSSQSLLQNPAIHLNGFKKKSPVVPDKGLLFSPHQVHQMVRKLRSVVFNPYDNTLLEAVFLTAFYGFLHCGGYTTSRSCSIICTI